MSGSGLRRWRWPARWPRLLWRSILGCGCLALAQLRISNYTQITHDGHTKFIGGTRTEAESYFTQGADRRDSGSFGLGRGPVAPIPVPLSDSWSGNVSPDGSSLLLISQVGGLGPADSLWSLHLLGGSLRRLANAVTSAWSPDGESVAYATASGDIYVIQSDGTEAHPNRLPWPSYQVAGLVARRGDDSVFQRGHAVGDVIERGQSSPTAAGMGEVVHAVERRVGSGWEILLCGRRPDMEFSMGAPIPTRAGLPRRCN